MFFAYVCLRPAAGFMDGPVRARMWDGSLGRFFVWVWVAVILMLLSGLAMIGQLGGFAHVGMYVNLMFALGIVMMLIYAHVFFAPYKRLHRAVAAGDSATAARQIGQIRRLVAINLVLGIIVLLLASAGKYWLA
jgi:Predicted integral membrane protein